MQSENLPIQLSSKFTRFFFENVESVSNRGDKMETKDTIPATGQRNGAFMNYEFHLNHLTHNLKQFQSEFQNKY